MINAAIVEDNIQEQQILKNMAVNFFSANNLDIDIVLYSSVREYNTAKIKYDLLLLDIMLGDGTGMELAKNLRDGGDDGTIIVFVTSLMNYAIEGYSVSASAYILKPLSAVEFELKMTSVLRKIMMNQKSAITLNTDNELVNIDASDILYVEVYGHYLTYHLKNEDYTVRQTLSSCESLLKSRGFFRISKFCIVNMNKITKVADDDIFIGQTRLKVSRSVKKEFKKCLLSSAP